MKEKNLHCNFKKLSSTGKLLLCFLLLVLTALSGCGRKPEEPYISSRHIKKSSSAEASSAVSQENHSHETSEQAEESYSHENPEQTQGNSSYTESYTESEENHSSEISSSEASADIISFNGTYRKSSSMPNISYRELEIFKISQNTFNYRLSTYYQDIGLITGKVFTAEARTDSQNSLILYHIGDSENSLLTFNSDGTIRVLITNYDGIVEDVSGVYEKIEETYENDNFEIPEFPEIEYDDNCGGLKIDSVLAESIRNELNLSPDTTLTEDILNSVTNLYNENIKLTSVEGVRYLSNLQSFYADKTYIRDISEFSRLYNLKQLDISNSYISEIPDFSECPQLSELFLGGNMITDISPLNKISNIQYVSLSSNRITDISPIKDISTIESLDLTGNTIINYISINDNQTLQNALPFSYSQCIEVEEKVQTIIEEIIDENMSDIEKEIAVYKYVIDNVEYEEGQSRVVCPAYLSIIMGVGVCGDYSEAINLLSTAAGLNSIIINSNSHMWNMIEIDGNWYHLDSLWDETNEDWIYFNRSTSFIYSKENHQFDLLRYPFAKKDISILQYSTAPRAVG